MRIRESDTPHGEAQRRRATITIGTLRQRQLNGESQRRRATITHWIAAPAAAQRRNSTPKAKTAGSSTRQARAPAQSASRAYSKGCALPRPPRLARNDLFAFAQNTKAPLDMGVWGRSPKPLNPKRLYYGWSGAGVQLPWRARLGQRSSPTLLVRGGSQPARAFAQAGPKP